jgi:hypothetical protein
MEAGAGIKATGAAAGGRKGGLARPGLQVQLVAGLVVLIALNHVEGRKGDL